MIPQDFIPTIDNVHAGYKSGNFTPLELITFLLQRSHQYNERNIWISTIDSDLLQEYTDKLENTDIDQLPLYGIPFAIKDNIDVTGFSTTAGCPEYQFTPEANATIVAKLIDAGAVPVGKTNLDQFATGLVGTRSPYGPCRNAFDPQFISGGSSAGSSVSVALGLVSFSLGTDTAGSGRVPAMLNNLVGLKPSRGLFSMTGVVPACRSLDCPSVFAFNTKDAATVFDVAQGFDKTDTYSRPNPFSNSSRALGNEVSPIKLAVPNFEQLEFYGDTDCQTMFAEIVKKWRSMGAEVTTIDFEPLLSAARLLYEGPWVAERYAAIESFIEQSPDAVHKVVRGIIQGAEGKTAVDSFNAAYQLRSYKAVADKILSEVDALLIPTAPRHYKVDELLADPVKLNSNMGYYTNFMNLLDLCGLAIPGGFLPSSMPFGFSLAAPAFNDTKLLNLAKRWEQENTLPYGVFKTRPESVSFPQPDVSGSKNIKVAVCGAHLQGFPLNWQLTERGAQCISTTETAPNYQMYLLDKTAPHKPGLIRDNSNGVSIAVEVWALPSSEFGSFVDNIPYPLGIGKLELADGSWVNGFICDAAAVTDSRNISSHGSWRRWVETV